jgi:hypothetical protein
MSNFKSYFSLTCIHEAIFFKSFFEVVYFSSRFSLIHTQSKILAPLSLKISFVCDNFTHAGRWWACSGSRWIPMMMTINLFILMGRLLLDEIFSKCGKFIRKLNISVPPHRRCNQFWSAWKINHEILIKLPLNQVRFSHLQEHVWCNVHNDSSYQGTIFLKFYCRQCLIATRLCTRLFIFRISRYIGKRQLFKCIARFSAFFVLLKLSAHSEISWHLLKNYKIIWVQSLSRRPRVS